MEEDKTIPGKSQPKKTNWTLIIIIVLVIVIIVLGYMYWQSQQSQEKADDVYQAVFLDNSQVYFGQIETITGSDIYLTDVYYLRAGASLQNEGEGVEGETAAESELSLVKLGNEIHGPTDEMVINKEHVLYIENLKDDSQVVKSIKEDKE